MTLPKAYTLGHSSHPKDYKIDPLADFIESPPHSNLFHP